MAEIVVVSAKMLATIKDPTKGTNRRAMKSREAISNIRSIFGTSV